MNLFEQILQFKGYPFAEAKKELAALQAMGTDEFLNWQQQRAWQQVRFHYTYNPLYKKLVGNTIPDKWEDLPIVTKKDLQQPLSSIITNGVNFKDCHTGNTSGSTGTPFFYAKDKMTHAMTWAVIADRYSWYGLTVASRQARFYGIPKEFVANSKEQLKDRMMNRERFSVFDLS
ncbi:MAG: phenylacetate--CoA ligase family protein, partial [Taibaiella sp.]|nr:phenylacetate--CoA ligase family protein [Taibaiella sp.]